MKRKERRLKKFQQKKQKPRYRSFITRLAALCLSALTLLLALILSKYQVADFSPLHFRLPATEASLSEKNFLRRGDVFFNSAKFPQTIEALSLLLQDADQNGHRNGVLVEINETRWRLDLSVADYLDSIADLTFDNPEVFLELKNTLSGKPLENFPLLLRKLGSIEKKYPELSERLADIRVHFYDENATLVPHSFFSSLAKVSMSWLGTHPSTQFYNSLIKNPEGSGLLRYLARDRQNYFTKELTLVKLRNSRVRDEVKRELKSYAKAYCEILSANFLQQNNSDLKVELKCPGKIDQAPSVRVRTGDSFEKSDDTLYRKRAAQSLFNAIQSRPDKRLLLKYLQFKILLSNSSRALPTQEENGIEHILLSPQYIYENMELLAPLLKQYNYSYLVSAGDDEHLLRLRKWIWKNHAEVEVKMPIKILRKPGPADAQALYPDLITYFPDRPWEPEDILYDASGRPVLISGFLKKIWRRGLVDPMKASVRPENIAGLSIGVGLGVATANPLVGAVSGSATRNVVKVYRYGRPLKNAIIPTLTEAAFLSIPAFGFIGGPLAEAAFWGGVKGLGQAALSGDPLLLSAVLGAGLDLVDLALPAKVINPRFGRSGPALIGSAFYEIGWSAVKGASQGALVQLIDSGDPDKILNSVKKGALIRSSGTLMRIALFGPRVSSPKLSDEEFSEIRRYYKDHLGVRITRDDLARLNYRASDLGLVGLLRQALQGADAERSYYLIGNVGANITKTDLNNRFDEIAPHEASHYADAKQTGSLKWFIQYIIEAIKHGVDAGENGNKFEHYHYSQ